MSDRHLVTTVRATLVFAILAVVRETHATQRFGPFQLSGNLQTTNLVRHPDRDTYEFVQNRNVARIRLDYDWLQGGRFYDRYEIPFLESSHLLILWRGVYDSIYDTTPGFRPGEIHGRSFLRRGTQSVTQNVFDAAQARGIPRRRLTLDGLSRRERDTLKFDNQLREAYADIKVRGIPLTVRAGRQQIVGRDRQQPPARPRERARPHLAPATGNPAPSLWLGRHPTSLLDDQVPLRRSNALALASNATSTPTRSRWPGC